MLRDDKRLVPQLKNLVTRWRGIVAATLRQQPRAAMLAVLGDVLAKLIHRVGRKQLALGALVSGLAAATSSRGLLRGRGGALSGSFDGEIEEFWELRASFSSSCRTLFSSSRMTFSSSAQRGQRPFGFLFEPLFFMPITSA